MWFNNLWPRQGSNRNSPECNSGFIEAEDVYDPGGGRICSVSIFSPGWTERSEPDCSNLLFRMRNRFRGNSELLLKTLFIELHLNLRELHHSVINNILSRWASEYFEFFSFPSSVYDSRHFILYPAVVPLILKQKQLWIKTYRETLPN